MLPRGCQNLIKHHRYLVGYFLIGAILGLSTACGAIDDLTNVKEKDKTPVEDFKSKLFVKSADFDLSKNTRKIPKSELGYELNQLSYLYNNTDTDSSSAAPPDNPCDFIFKDAKYKGQKGVLEISYAVTVENCQSEISTEVYKSHQTINYQARIYAIFICDNVDYSPLDGKTFLEVDQIRNANKDLYKCSSAERKSAFNVDVKMNLESVDSNAEGDQLSKFTLNTVDRSANISALDDLCVEKQSGETYVIDQCLALESMQGSTLIEGQPSEQSEVTITKLAMQNIILDQMGTEPWYGGGSVDLTLANWRGNVTYSGFAQAGQFTLNDGTEQVTGLLPPWGSITPFGGTPVTKKDSSSVPDPGEQSSSVPDPGDLESPGHNQDSTSSSVPGVDQESTSITDSENQSPTSASSLKLQPVPLAGSTDYDSIATFHARLRQALKIVRLPR